MQREASRPRPSTLKLPRKPSARDLRLLSKDEWKNSDESEVPPVPVLSRPKTSPGRGLTIDTRGLPPEAGSLPALKSAPAIRTIRKLPAPPLTRSSTSPFPSGTSINAPRHLSIAPSPSRGKRPLPSLPPTKAKDALPTIDTNIAPSTSLPTSCRTSKPLPTPVQKIERDFLPVVPSLDQSLSQSQPIQTRDATPPPLPPKTIPQRTRSPSPPRTPKRKTIQNAPSIDDTPTPRPSKRSLAQALRSKDAPTAVMLHTRMIFEQDQKLNSIDMHVYDDTSSRVSFSRDAMGEPAVTHPDGYYVSRKTPPRQSSEASGVVLEKDHKHAADYAFVLANRILYQQTSNDGRSTLTSKWVREVKGKRYTEQNFDNVIQALRTL